MKIFNWNIINETSFDITCDYFSKDIIIVDKATNRQLVYFKYNIKEDIYTEDEKVHKVITQINTMDKSITIYDNIASNYRTLFMCWGISGATKIKSPQPHGLQAI